QIVRHLESVFAALPPCVRQKFARADAGFYCWDAVEAYEKAKACFIIVARKTRPLLEELQKAHWQPSCKTDAGQQCEFWYQPGDWGQAYRFIALRYKKENSEPEREQYQLFESPQYRYRVFGTARSRRVGYWGCVSVWKSFPSWGSWLGSAARTQNILKAQRFTLSFSRPLATS